MGEKETVLTTEIPREDGYLYWVSKDDKGNIKVERTKMQRAGRPRIKKVK